MANIPNIATKGFITLGDNPKPSAVVMFTSGIVTEGLQDMIRPQALERVRKIQTKSKTMSLNTITVFEEISLSEIITKVEATARERHFDTVALFAPTKEVNFYEETCGYTKAVCLGRGKGYFMTKDLIN